MVRFNKFIRPYMSAGESVTRIKCTLPNVYIRANPIQFGTQSTHGLGLNQGSILRNE